MEVDDANEKNMLYYLIDNYIDIQCICYGVYDERIARGTQGDGYSIF